MKKRQFKRPDAPPNEHEIASEGLPSASGFNAEFRCPGKRALCARLPREDDTAVTERGRRIHRALETNDFSALNDSEQRTAWRIAYGESEIIHEYGFEGAHIVFERRVWDIDDELNHLWSAQIDRYDWQPESRRLLVIDDKSGWTIPPAIHENWQVRSEAALLAEELDALEAVVALIHPHHPDSLWEAKVYTRKELQHLLDIVRQIVPQIQATDTRRIPGAIQCEWCVAKGICPERKAADAALDKAAEDEVIDGGMTAIYARSREERGQHVSALKQRNKGNSELLKRYAAFLVKEPDSIAGWRLTTKADRYVTSETTAMELVRDEFGTDVLYSSIKFSVSALETELAKKMPMKEAKAAVVRVLGSVIKNKKSDPYLTEARSL